MNEETELPMDLIWPLAMVFLATNHAANLREALERATKEYQEAQGEWKAKEPVRIVPVNGPPYKVDDVTRRRFKLEGVRLVYIDETHRVGPDQS